MSDLHTRTCNSRLFVLTIPSIIPTPKIKYTGTVRTAMLWYLVWYDFGQGSHHRIIPRAISNMCVECA